MNAILQVISTENTQRSVLGSDRRSQRNESVFFSCKLSSKWKVTNIYKERRKQQTTKQELGSVYERVDNRLNIKLLLCLLSLRNTQKGIIIAVIFQMAQGTLRKQPCSLTIFCLELTWKVVQIIAGLVATSEWGDSLPPLSMASH